MAFDWSQGGQGAAGGALTGAAAGATLGPIGAGVGALIGGGLGLLGGFGGDGGAAERDRRAQQLYAMAQRGPGVQNMDWQGSEWRANQGQLRDQLMAMSQGRGPSVAGQMLQAQADRGSAQQAGLAAAAGGRGVNQGAALRNAAGQSAALQMGAAQEAAIARTREQEMAMGQLQQLLGQARGQDMQGQSANMANQYNNWNARFGGMGQAAGLFAQPTVPTGTALMGGGLGAAPGIGQGLAAYNESNRPKPQAPVTMPNGAMGTGGIGGGYGVY